MKSNYTAPKLIIKVYDLDVITTSAPEATVAFDEAWLED